MNCLNMAENKISKSKDSDKSVDRISYIDIAKGIGLILVIFGHLFRYGGRPSIFIFSFHMPLFFIISGFCFNPDKNNDFKHYLVKKVKSLLLPYLTFCILGFTISMFVPEWRADISAKILFEQVFYLAAPELCHVGQVWFLVCLFFVEVFSFIIYKNIFKKMEWWLIVPILCALACLGYNSYFIAIQYFPLGRMPWKIDSAITAIVLYFIGFYFKKSKLSARLLSVKSFWLIVSSIITITVTYILSINYLGWANISSLSFGPQPVLYYCCAVLGTYSVMAISIYISKISQLDIIRIVGKRSLFVFAVHSLVLYAIIGASSKLYGYTITMGQNPPYGMVIYGGLFATVLLFGITNAVNDWMDKCKSRRIKRALSLIGLT